MLLFPTLILPAFTDLYRQPVQRKTLPPEQQAETHFIPHSPVSDCAPGTELSAPSSAITVKMTLAHSFF